MMATTNTTNATSQMPDKMKLNGTINVHATIAEAFKSKVTTDIIGSIQAAQASVGANSVVKQAELTHAHGFLIYKITAVDENMKKYKVIVDPGNDQIELINLVTQYRLFISNLLNDLLKKNSRKYQIICNYINAEQTEFNKESTKIRKIKTHVYLSRYCDNKKSYNIQR